MCMLEFLELPGRQKVIKIRAAPLLTMQLRVIKTNGRGGGGGLHELLISVPCEVT